MHSNAFSFIVFQSFQHNSTGSIKLGRERDRQTDRDERVLKEVQDCRIYIIVYFKILLGI